MPPRRLFVVFFVIFLFLPVNASVPISADNNNDILNALTVENQTDSYVIYGNLHQTGDTGYYKFRLNNADRLTLEVFSDSYLLPGGKRAAENLCCSGSQTGLDDAIWGELRSSLSKWSGSSGLPVSLPV